MNTAANRAAAIPSLLTSSYKEQTALNDAYMKASEYNNLLTAQEAEFNSKTNAANAQAALTNARANQSTALQSAVYRAQMQEEIDRYISEANSANLSGLIQNLSDLGTDQYNMKQAKETAKALAACGGKLKRRKKKGLTY